jgi:uncharacterized membrane protein
METLSSYLPPLAVEITGPYVIQLVSRVLHILSAIILVGGLFYIRTILAPSASSPATSSKRIGDTCFGDRRAVWAKWVGISTAFLLLTGIYNFIIIIGESKADGGIKLPPTYHMLFGVKFLLAMMVMFIAAILAGKTEAADRFRLQMKKWLNIGWLAAVAIIVIAAILRTLH